MPVPTVDPKVSIKNLVKNNWVAANIVGTTTPDFHTGWWNPKSLAAQLTFGSRSESFQGVSGYDAIEGGGGGPVQIANGVLFANCWAFRDEGASGPNPKQLVYDMAEETRRIVLANYDQISNLDFVSILSVDEVEPNPNEQPMVFRMAVTVGYKWRTT
jgi:hypothetical protein